MVPARNYARGSTRGYASGRNSGRERKAIDKHDLERTPGSWSAYVGAGTSD